MENELYHYGVLGMKWGIRRYQNADGSLTDAGKRHYGANKPIGDSRHIERARDANYINRKINKLSSKKRQTDSRKAKIERLSQIEKGLVKDLDTREVELGKKLDVYQRDLQAMMMPLQFIGGIALSVPVSLAYSAFYLNATKEGKELKSLEKELHKENKDAKRTKKLVDQYVKNHPGSGADTAPEGYHWERTGGMKADGTLWDGRKLVKDKKGK